MKNNWHDLTSLQLAIARAILHNDKRGEAILRQILAEETIRGNIASGYQRYLATFERFA